MVNKSGQFYLIAAIVFATIIIGFITISNYSKQTPNVRIDDLKEEIQIESAYVLDYGINNSFSESQIYALLNDFAQAYIDSESGTKDLYFVFGTSSNLTVKGYQETNKVVTVTSGTATSTVTSSAGTFDGSINPDGTDILLTVDDDSYSFELNTGYNFYFVIYETIEGNIYIVTNALGGLGTGIGGGIGEEYDGITERIIFVTSSAPNNGNLGGIVGADAICQSAADSSSSTIQGLTFIAWLSNDTLDAEDRIPPSEDEFPFMKNDGLGTIVADNLDDLIDGTLDSPIDYNEVGSSVNNQEAWTGTLPDGTSSPGFNCNNWFSSSGSIRGEAGNTLYSTNQWTSNTQDPCATDNKRLYCVQVNPPEESGGGLILENPDLISFLSADNFEGVDNPTGWSTSSNVVTLTPSWSLLSQAGLVSITSGNLRHRGNRGLGGQIGDTDEIDVGENITVAFDDALLITSIEVRSFYTGEGPGNSNPEEGDIKFYLNGNLVDSRHLIATSPSGDGILIQTYQTPILADTIIFLVESGQSYSSYSEFAVSRISIQVP